MLLTIIIYLIRAIMTYSMGENQFNARPTCSCRTYPQAGRQQHPRRRGVRHRQGPRVQHRPADAEVRGMPLSSAS